MSPPGEAAARLLEDAAESKRWATRGLIEESSGLLLLPREERGALLHTRRDEVVVVVATFFPMMAFASPVAAAAAVVDVRVVVDMLVSRNAWVDVGGRRRQADDINDRSGLHQNRRACISMVPPLLLSRLPLLSCRRRLRLTALLTCWLLCKQVQQVPTTWTLDVHTEPPLLAVSCCYWLH